MDYDLIIVGGGTAGLTAALYALRGGLKVLLLEGAVHGGQIVASPEVENYPALPGVSGDEYAQKLLQQVRGAAAESQLTLKYQAVTGLKVEGVKKTAQTPKGEYSAPALIWAVGVNPRRLGCPGEEKFLGRGSSFCATCDGPLYRGQKVAVIGGGNTALEEALFLAGICSGVHLLHRRGDFRAEQALQQKVLAEPKITLHFHTQVTAMLGEGRLSAVELQTPHGQEVLPVAAVFTAIGKLPANQLLRPYTRLTADGYIDAAEDCLTDTHGLLAAGDCRAKPLRQLVTAAADGAVAAEAAVSYLRSLQ